MMDQIHSYYVSDRTLYWMIIYNDLFDRYFYLGSYMILDIKVSQIQQPRMLAFWMVTIFPSIALIYSCKWAYPEPLTAIPEPAIISLDS
ncbi:hypothetical protein J3Q64DRAFT_1428480 [Phycomyces blakesleeanus]|uniref:Uncharacterized protein n=1 Tax=Phycomyces blakesleeanus TaxID=4837 RepID=A0ABR3AHW1_PHYBL